MEESKKQKSSGLKLHMVRLHQPISFPDDKGNPIGNTTSTFGTAATNGGPTYILEPHPMGVKIKKKANDNHGLLVPSANIQGIIFFEE